MGNSARRKMIGEVAAVLVGRVLVGGGQGFSASETRDALQVP